MEQAIGLVMHKIFGSLRFRIFSGSFIVLLLGLLIVNLYSRQMAEIQIEAFETRASEAQAQRIENYFRDQNTLSGGSSNELAKEAASLAKIFGKRVVFQDERGRILADSKTEKRIRSLVEDKSLMGLQVPKTRKKYLEDLNRTPPFNDKFRNLPIYGVNNISSIAVGPSVDGFQPPPEFSELRNEFNRSLIVAGVIGSIFGLIIASLTSNWVLSPIRQLKSSVSRFGSGQLNERVEVKGSGELAELAQSFNVMAERMDAAHQQRKKLIADISHELRTPISNIQGYIEAIEDEILEPNDNNMKIMHDQIIQLSNVVEDLRVLAEVDSGELKLKKELKLVKPIIEGAVQGLNLNANEKHITIVTNVGESEEVLLIDEERIRQIVTNLLNNAIRYSPEGSQIDINLNETDRAVQISVSDNGPGIPDSDIEFVFNRFYRVDSSRDRASGGRGLGLSIAKEFVEAHGGNIWVESDYGNGSQFTFEIPKRTQRT